MSEQNVLYRFFNATGQLLYVGITMNPPQRFKAHQNDKHWWSEVVGITVERYVSREELAAAERRAIRVERPQHNVIYNGNRPTNPLCEWCNTQSHAPSVMCEQQVAEQVRCVWRKICEVAGIVATPGASFPAFPQRVWKCDLEGFAQLVNDLCALESYRRTLVVEVVTA